VKKRSVVVSPVVEALPRVVCPVMVRVLMVVVAKEEVPVKEIEDVA
jgi:hypothetical protein